MRGRPVEFRSEHLDQVVANFAAEGSRVPVVIGHPETNAPSYGWVNKVERVGDAVYADADVHPSFAAVLKDGFYGPVSPSLWGPEQPGNPKPGEWTLRHIGVLGAAAPAIPGLEPVELSGGHEDFQLIEEQDPVTYKTTDLAAELAAKEAALAEREAKLADAEKAAAAAQARAVRDGAMAFAAGLVDAHRLAPAAKDAVVELQVALAGAAVEPFAFAAGGDKVDPLTAFRKLFEGAQPLVPLGEVAGAATDPETGSTYTFSAPVGVAVEARGAKIDAEAKRLMAADPKLSYSEAAIRASKSIA
ncbi:MAG: hypothetical protein RQ833_07335 [Sphingomonadaceae bacterium]|nr:hypothetical protein [Sphingomonadaceae bacterium]